MLVERESHIWDRVARLAELVDVVMSLNPIK